MRGSKDKETRALISNFPYAFAKTTQVTRALNVSTPNFSEICTFFEIVF